MRGALSTGRIGQWADASDSGTVGQSAPRRIANERNRASRAAYAAGAVLSATTGTEDTVMRRNDSRGDGPISREQLEFLAAISPEWRDELRRRDRAAAEAAHRQDLDDFVRAITVPDWSTRGRSPTSAETQEFVEAITRPAWPDERPITREEVDRFVDAITGRGGSTIREAGWDPAKHPRRGGPPNAGWWASTSGGGSSSGSTTSNSASDRQTANDSMPNRDTHGGASPSRLPSQIAGHDDGHRNDGGTPAKTTEFSPSHGATAHLTASSPGGHHWIPRQVIKDLSHRMTEEAKRIFSLGTEAIDHYYHANDTWNGVKHHQYSTAVHELLDDWITRNGGQLDEEGARIFQSWLATGETKNRTLLSLLSKHEKAVATALRWRTGFKQSIVVAARAAELNKNLTGPELKAVAKLIVNGEAQALSPQARCRANDN